MIIYRNSAIVTAKPLIADVPLGDILENAS